MMCYVCASHMCLECVRRTQAFNIQRSNRHITWVRCPFVTGPNNVVCGARSFNAVTPVLNAQAMELMVFLNNGVVAGGEGVDRPVVNNRHIIDNTDTD